MIVAIFIFSSPKYVVDKINCVEVSAKNSLPFWHLNEESCQDQNIAQTKNQSVALNKKKKKHAA